MKVTNKTAYATIGCDVQLSENDRLALGIELDKVTNWLEAVEARHMKFGEESETESLKAVNKIVAFVSKFAIRPSETNVFTDSPEEFKKVEESVTAVEPNDHK
jgi:acyl carrier protein